MDRGECQRNMSERPDDKFSIVCGDLGLGEGLKPGGILQNFNLSEICDEVRNRSLSDAPCSANCHMSCSDIENNDSTKLKKPERRLSIVLKSNEKHRPADLTCQDESLCSAEYYEKFPTYADVPLGTSLRQQKKLFQQNLGCIRKRHELSTSDEPDDKANGDKREHRLSSSEIEKKLVEVIQDVEELKIELDTCQKRLGAKYMAIAILKKQADETMEEQTITEKIAKECSKMLLEDSAMDLSLDGSAGGGDLDLGEELSPPPHELLWDDEALLKRVCQENSLLMATLEARSEELRKANSQKMARARERDELLALLDVREKLKYEKTRSTSADDDYGMYSSAELAVLGACHCRTTQPEPCGCAHAAANLRKDIIRIKEEIELYKHRRDEAYLTVDAYRKAFEEQLHRNRTLTVKLSELTVPPSSKTVKAKAAIKWLISVLNDDDIGMTLPKRGLDGSPNGPMTNASTALMSPQEIIVLLTEMVHEKSEALAYQKLGAQVLANKVETLEKQLTTLRDSDILT